MKKWSNTPPGTGLDELRGWQEHLKNRTKGEIMPDLTDKVVERVYRGKAGSSEKSGDWQFYSIYLVGGTLKYDYLHSGQKPIPVEGTKIANMTYEVEQKGEYTNNKIKKLMVAQDSPVGNAPDKNAPDKKGPPEFPKVSPEAAGSTLQQIKGAAYINHGQVVVDLMNMAGGPACDTDTLNILIDLFKEGIERMVSPLAPWERTAKEEPLKSFTEIPKDDIPF